MTLSRKRFYSIGAQGGGTLYRRFYNRINTENFIDFLVHLYEEYGMFVIFLDNAPCHKSRALQEFPGGMNGEIRIYSRRTRRTRTRRRGSGGRSGRRPGIDCIRA